jgi:hypothetical protein
MDIENLGSENELLQTYADMHLQDTMRIILSKQSTPEDANLIYDALCLITAIYMKRIQSGEIHVTDRVYH